MSQGLITAWYKGAWWLLLLWPLSLLYRALRRLSILLAKAPASNTVPLLVVGNISLGGTGKTPVVQALVRHLAERGIRCGIISRGYGGQVGKGPHLINGSDSPASVGDEPWLLWQTTGAPVVVGSDRHADMAKLQSEFELDLIISDDGLQNTSIKGDCEWLLIDGQRGLGNGQCLPMGPLREPANRLHHVDAVFITASQQANEIELPVVSTPVYTVTPKLADLRRIEDDQIIDWPTAGTQVRALAGIGNPQRFFDDLSARGLVVDGTGFADHYDFEAQDLDSFLDARLIMTAKDAVKCRKFVGLQQPNWLYAEQSLELPEPAVMALIKKLNLDAKKEHHG